MAVITETWLRESELGDLKNDLSGGSGFSILARNRDENGRGVSYGGVAVLWRETLGTFNTVKLKNPQSYEVLAAAGSIKGHKRKLVVVAAYIPPGYDSLRGKGALDFIENTIIEVKRRFTDPYIVVAGDFNQWKVESCLANFGSLKEIEVGNTRGNRAIDRVFLNFGRSVTESGTPDAVGD